MNMLSPLRSGIRKSVAKKWIALVGMCLVSFIMAYNTTAVLTALPSIQTSFQLSSSSMQWIVNIYMLTCTSFIILGGRMGRKYGYRNTILISSLCFVLASIVVAMAPDINVLLIGRIFQGISASFMGPTTLAVTKKVFPKEQQTMAIGAWSASLSLGLATGPVIGGALIALFSWQYVFWVNIPCLLVAVALISLTARSNYKIKKIPVAFTGTVLLILGIVPLNLGLIEGDNLGWGLYAFLLIALGAVVLYIFWLIEKKSKHPLVNFNYFRIQQFTLGVLGLTIAAFCFMGILYYFNKYFQSQLLLNFSPLKTGLALMPIIATISISSLLASRLNKKFGFRKCAGFSLFLIIIGFAWLTRININTTYNDLWLPLLICGIGVGIALPSYQSISMKALPDEQAGETAGLLNMVNYLSGVLSISICGIVYSVSKKYFLHLKLSSIQNLTVTKQQQLYNLFIQPAGDTAPHSLINNLNSGLQNAIIEAVKQAKVMAFSNIMLTLALFAITGTILCFAFLRKRNVRV
jgi:EmrB/QacA subfamily drug resistance transporter